MKRKKRRFWQKSWQKPGLWTLLRTRYHLNMQRNWRSVPSSVSREPPNLLLLVSLGLTFQNTQTRVGIELKESWQSKAWALPYRTFCLPRIPEAWVLAGSALPPSARLRLDRVFLFPTHSQLH